MLAGKKPMEVTRLRITAQGSAGDDMTAGETDFLGGEPITKRAQGWYGFAPGFPLPSDIRREDCGLPYAAELGLEPSGIEGEQRLK